MMFVLFPVFIMFTFVSVFVFMFPVFVPLSISISFPKFRKKHVNIKFMPDWIFTFTLLTLQRTLQLVPLVRLHL